MVEHPTDRNHEELDFLREYVEAVREDLPPEAWCLSARRQLRDALESPKEESWIMKLIKNGQHGKLRWALAIAATVIIIAIMAGISPVFRGSSIAFADVVRIIRNARTVSYTQIMHHQGH